VRFALRFPLLERRIISPQKREEREKENSRAISLFFLRYKKEKRERERENDAKRVAVSRTILGSFLCVCCFKSIARARFCKIWRARVFRTNGTPWNFHRNPKCEFFLSSWGKVGQKFAI
jgi:hypothetical protein